MGTVSEPALSSAPAFPSIVKLKVPSTVAPLKKVAVKGWGPNKVGSTSNPTVLEGTARVTVSVELPLVCSTRGVALSVNGGAFHVAHPPFGTVWMVTLG